MESTVGSRRWDMCRVEVVKAGEGVSTVDRSVEQGGSTVSSRRWVEKVGIRGGGAEEVGMEEGVYVQSVVGGGGGVQ